MDSKIICEHEIDNTISFGVELEVGLSSKSLGSNRRKEGHRDEELNDLGKRRTINLLKDNGFKAIDEHDFNKNWKTVKSWVIGYDSSIDFDSQIELRSPILKGEKGLKQVTDLIVLLRENEYEFDESCGLHVHIDCSQLSFKAIKNLIIFFICYEKEINSLLPKHRSNNDYCMELNSYIKDKMIPLKIQVNKAKSYSELWKLFPERHIKVNVAKLITDGNNKTIEFRQHHMTFNRIEIRRWIRFLCFMYIQSEEGCLIDSLNLIDSKQSEMPKLNELIT